MKQYNRSGGTTLVITLALLAALAIIGTTMISMARMDRFAARSYRLNTQMDLAADAALEWFGARWAEEYWTRAVPYYSVSGVTSTTRPAALPAFWNSYDVMLPNAAGLASRGDSCYDDDSLVSLLGVGGTFSTLAQAIPLIARVGNTSNTCYKITTTASTTNVPYATWPLPNAGNDGYIYPELRFPAGPNRIVEVSLTTVDLGGRFNVNFIGSSTGAGLPAAPGACSSWRGASIQEVTPGDGVAPFVAGQAYLSAAGLQSLISGSAGISIGRGGTGSGGTPTGISELIDGTMNPFAPGIYASAALTGSLPGVNLGIRPLPYTIEDLSELLNIAGTTSAGTFWSRLVAQDYNNFSPFSASLLYRTYFTTHSWTSAARRNYYRSGGVACLNEDPSNQTLPWVKADLNNAPQADLEKALLATRLFLSTNATDMRVLEQIVANIMDYRREGFRSGGYGTLHSGPTAGALGTIGHPTLISSSPSGATALAPPAGVQGIIGVQRQPYINEVFVKFNSTTATSSIFDVFVELANPYDLAISTSGYSMTIGDDGTGPNNVPAHLSTATAMTSSIVGATSPGLAGGIVVGTKITIPAFNLTASSPTSSVTLIQCLQPIRLYATTTNSAGSAVTVLIDRMKTVVSTTVSNVQGLQNNNQSCQRPTYPGTSHAGTALNFFGGYMEAPPPAYDIFTGSSAAMVGLTTPCAAVVTPTNTTATVGTNRVRPIENRSRTWYQGANPVRSRAYYPAWGAPPSTSSPELSFASPGDLCRLLIIGPGFGYQSLTTGNGGIWSATGTLGFIAATQSLATGNIYTVTEQLGAAAAASATPDPECDVHIDLAKISTKNATSGGSAPYDWRRLIDVFNVNSPYYDGLDNSGRGQVVDNQFTGAATNSQAAIVGELYEHGRINLLTAPPAVIQGMLAPLMGRISAANPTLSNLTSPGFYTLAIRKNPTPGNVWKSPADVLDISTSWAQSLFWGTNRDDDGNGAFNDYAKKCWLYTYMSNWATIRSDCVAVYGTVRLNDSSTGTSQILGLRHFVAVMDRVPATAYQPILYKNGVVPYITNPNYQPPRRLMLTWLD